MEKTTVPRKSDKLLYALCILFSIVSIVALIIGVLSITGLNVSMDDSSNSSEDSTSTSYCSLDILNVGNYSLGVSDANQNELVLQSNLSTYPKIVFNLMDTDQPMMVAFNENNYFYYGPNNTYDIVQDYEPNIFQNSRVCTFGCKQTSVTTVEFANGVTLETSNNALRVTGTNAQWLFNTSANVFEILNTSQSSDSSNSVLYFDGQYLCTNPTKSTCIGKAPELTLQLNDASESSDSGSKTNPKINGITFSNGYTLSTDSNGLKLKGSNGVVNFNVSGTGADIFTVENSFYYFYYSYNNTFGSIIKNNSVTATSDLLPFDNASNCSVFKKVNSYGLSNPYKQPLNSFQLKQNTDQSDNKSIYYDYSYSDDYIFPSQTATHTYKTNGQNADDENNSCDFLDRHDVKCNNDNEFLYGFQLNYDKDKKQYSYQMQCAEYPGGTQGCINYSSKPTTKDGGLEELMSKVQCPGDSYLTQFKLNTKNNQALYDYRCCKKN